MIWYDYEMIHSCLMLQENDFQECFKIQSKWFANYDCV